MYDAVKFFYSGLCDDTKEELRRYLEKRFEARKTSPKIGVVFDVLRTCILRCRGCGTDASFSSDMKRISCAPSTEDIKTVFRKLREYSDMTGKRVFMNIGGGEPFLRNDILDILKLSAEYFGAENTGVDTNAAMSGSEQLISEAMPYVSYVGISINGLREYHNRWSGNSGIDAFERASFTVRKLCEDPVFRDKIEVTSVATKENIAELPDLMNLLADMGVKKYSVHRAIPVGRMAAHRELIPDAADYLGMLVSLIKCEASEMLDFHVHHSIESIHAALLLDFDTYMYDRIGNPDALSSIGIDPECNVVFDPWCTTGCLKKLSSGNLLSYPGTLDEMLRDGDSVFRKSAFYTSAENRCRGCRVRCSGGSRIVAAANELCGRADGSVTEEEIYSAMQSKDPACPLYCV